MLQLFFSIIILIHTVDILVGIKTCSLYWILLSSSIFSHYFSVQKNLGFWIFLLYRVSLIKCLQLKFHTFEAQCFNSEDKVTLVFFASPLFFYKVIKRFLLLFFRFIFVESSQNSDSGRSFLRNFDFLFGWTQPQSASPTQHQDFDTPRLF